MALPFLNKKKETGIAGTIIQQRESDSHDSPESEEPEEYSLEDCAHDILDAIHSNDAKALASALQEAFLKLESEPHEESEHKASPHTYESQNIKAGQE